LQLENKSFIHSYFRNNISVLILFFFAFFIHLIYLKRYVGGDEGLFLLQARMLADGILPVKDYFSKDAPYFLFPYSLIMSLFGFSITVSRITTYLLSSLVITLVFQITNYMIKDCKVALSSSLVVLFSVLYFGEGTPLEIGHGQTAIVFLLSSLLFLIKGVNAKLEKNKIIYFVLFAILGSFSVWSRLPFVFPVIVMGFYWIWIIIKSSIQNTKKIIYFCVVIFSALFASTYMIVLYLYEPEKFIFSYFAASNFFRDGNWYGMFGDYANNPWEFRWNALVDFISVYRGQNAILLMMMFISFVSRIRKPTSDKRIDAIYWVIVVMCLSFLVLHIFLTPHGFSWHYFGSIAPLFAIVSFPFIEKIFSKIDRNIISRIVLTLFVVSYLSYGILRVGKYAYKNSINHVETHRDINVLEQLSEKIEKYVESDAETFISQPYLYFLTGNYPNLLYINSSWLHQLMAAGPNGQDMSRFHIPTSVQFSSKIRKKDYKVIVLYEGHIDQFDKIVKKNILENYQLAEMFKGYSIYTPFLIKNNN
jgi:hypothetical protein